MTKKRRRHTPEQIIRKLAEGNKLQAGGMELDEVCRWECQPDLAPPCSRVLAPLRVAVRRLVLSR